MKSTSKWLLIPIFLSLIALCSCENNSIEEVEASGDLSTLLSRNGQSRSGTPHEFPLAEEIMFDTYVVSCMEKAWDKMVSLVEPYDYRQEVGFYIYYDHGSRQYWVGEMVIGPKTSYNTVVPASLDLGRVEDNLQVCAFFHCHTPWYGFCAEGREPGVSDSDINFADTHKLPGIVFDYDTPFLTDNFPIDWPHRPYFCGPKKRPPVYY